MGPHPSQAGVNVRRLLLAVLFFGFGFAGNAVAQCPILPRQASVDPNEKRVTIRYYNSGGRVVQAVEFTVRGLQAGQGESAVIARYSARQILSPKIEKTAVFERFAGRSDLNVLEVEVMRVMFTDQTMWKPGRENTCKVSFSPR
jgi:hypothetical protein